MLAPTLSRRFTVVLAFLSTLLLLGLVIHRDKIPSASSFKISLEKQKPTPPKQPKPRYKKKPDYLPPPIKDNFPLIASSTPPPIPKWNVAPPDLHKKFDLPEAPPLLIGFSRSWPILLQAVVSYITAGWPADQIYIVENTGVQQANSRGQLSLQNPFFLNHTALKTLGVNIIQTPTLLSFAQLQNFYLSLSYTHSWSYYFWSHMDVLVLSYEDGKENLTPKYNDPDYQPLYALALRALHDARRNDPRWATRFFSYDHLTAVNPLAYEDVGGWDTLIPYYITDCDMHSRLAMRNWTMLDAHAGIITDVNTSLEDLGALYRIDGIDAQFLDPNPPRPESTNSNNKKNNKREHTRCEATFDMLDMILSPRRDESQRPPSQQLDARTRVGIYRRGNDAEDPNLARWRKLLKTADTMFHYKHGSRGRNTWQTGQHGGQGEPFYYDAAGLAEAIDLATENGKEVYRRKWGHRDCDLIKGAGLRFDDQWKVEKDWE